MSSSASLLRPSPSLDGQCLDSCLLSPKYSSHAEGLDCLSPRMSVKPASQGGFKSAEKGANSNRFSAEFDKGPDAAAFAKLRGTWQLAATGKPAAAAVLNDLKVQRIHDGGREGVKALASKLISQHQLDDTFYVMDLANVVRLYKSYIPAIA